MNTEADIAPFSALADKIESKLKLHQGLQIDLRFVMNADAATAFVDMLRKTGQLIEELSAVRTERDDLKADYMRRHRDAVDRYEALSVIRELANGPGMPRSLLDQIFGIATKARRSAPLIATVREGGAT